MKNIIQIILLIFLVSCIQKNEDNSIKLYGTIENPILNTNIFIRSNEIDLNYGYSKYEKIIHVNSDGKFSDTLNLPAREYELFYNGHSSSIYLDKGYSLNIKFDANDVISTIQYSGKGNERNQFNSNKQRILLNASNEFTNNTIKNIDSFVKVKLIDEHSYLIDSFSGRLHDSILSKKEVEFNDFFKNKKFANLYLKKLLSEKSKKALIGKLSEEFSFENIIGEKVTLNDFKGKFVFIDIWATWCGPCIYEIPFLEKVYNQFENKNITFVSVSIDHPTDKVKWINFLEREKPIGIQLFENKNGNSEFIKSLKSNSIPRYLLINPNGEFVNLDLPKPSSTQKLIDLLTNELSLKTTY